VLLAGEGAVTVADEVGVATDGETLAAARSTGGRRFALPGRVGDFPQVGAGLDATPAAAASATGGGEAFEDATGVIVAGRDGATGAAHDAAAMGTATPTD
jgi:isoaspartyl peptidase/L-asparaginase-like protein (Ntn-hydrolase superfamily)